MPFRRLFERGAKAPTPQTLPADEEALDSEALDGEALDGEAEFDDAPEAAEDRTWRERAAAVLPTGSSTGSKRPAALYGDANADGPTHFVQAVGCRVIGADQMTYIDCTMALGSVALGYAEPNVTRAVIDAAAHGTVSGLASVREVEVAERLCGAIPCAELAQFVKSGAEAIAAAVRIARTYTGRDLVIGSGYFGWLDWCSDARGVPEGTRRDFVSVPFDDVQALEAAAADAGPRLAAIVLEPVVERLPSAEWIARARALCDAAGAVLIFDELKTGFRLATGGYQSFAQDGPLPDLAAYGKAMANGYALGAVVGREPLMRAARDTWISSTLAGETTALAAAAAVLEWHEEADICAGLWATGKELRAAVQAAMTASGVAGVTMEGIDPMWFLRWDTPTRETRFLELAAANGVLVKRGAYNYAALAHDEEAIREIESGVSAALVALVEEESA
jgi:glutamate-1-semialdehyde 2,1-aminomutase